jgi:NAD(P)-dependent dehydrogenase (short-subunit alcohol dehydrogenase family)
LGKGNAIYPDLDGRCVLVTGGASGIGEAIVRGFARQKAKVGFLDLQAERGAALASELAAGGGTIRFETCDLRDIDDLRRAIGAVRAALGPITVLVNNAANDDRHATANVTPAYFDERIAVNLRHAFFAAQAVLPDMKAAQGGAIVNFSSISWMAGMGGMAIYTAAKSAMLGLTRSLARDFGPDNVRVNAIAPGWVLTERQTSLWLTPEGDRRRLDAQCLKRWIVPDDIANLVLFLSADAGSACTAQTYVMDGGWV